MEEELLLKFLRSVAPVVEPEESAASRDQVVADPNPSESEMERLEAMVLELLGDGAGIKADVASRVSSLVKAGESDLAVVTLLEMAPHLFPVDHIDEMERIFRNSGAYVEREAVNAINAYRREADNV